VEILLKIQKDREQLLKDKYNFGSITAAERRDFQQFFLKKDEFTDNVRDLLMKLSLKQD
jgi:hypothetical protein